MYQSGAVDRYFYFSMAGELPIGIPQILSTVTICVCLIAFILQIHEARESDAIDAGDHVLVGAFGYV